MNKQAILDVLNNLEVVEQQGGEDAYILVKNNLENCAKLVPLGVKDSVINSYGDKETFCILALAYGEGYANFYHKGLVNWPDDAVDLIESLYEERNWIRNEVDKSRDVVKEVINQDLYTSPPSVVHEKLKLLVGQE